MEDLSLLEGGRIDRGSLFTLRNREVAWDNIRGRLVAVDGERVKIREREGGGCIFYDESGRACTIYAHRPAQCAALNCWDPAEFEEVYRRPRLTRADIVSQGALLGLIEEHERRCGHDTLEQHVRGIAAKGDEALQAVLEMLRFDFHLRPLAREKLGIPPQEMDFLFGRPLVRTISRFGLEVIREPGGTFLLTTLPRGEGVEG
jgi:Fe-S-cluster containining protein